MIKFKSIYRLIRRFIVFFILLLLINILVIFIAGFSKANSASITSTLNLIAEQTDISQAKVELEDNAQKTIEQNDLWMMVLDENGNHITHLLMLQDSVVFILMIIRFLHK